MKKFEFVDDIAEWKRWWSLRWLAATAFFTAVVLAYQTLPADWLPQIAPAIKQWLAVGALVSAGGAAVSRVLKQPKAE